ncbi:hypothetical protein ACFQY5_14815 [Paeniroseomonas aquatica]
MQAVKGSKSRLWGRAGADADVSFLEEVDRAEAARRRPPRPPA